MPTENSRSIPEQGDDRQLSESQRELEIITRALTEEPIDELKSFDWHVFVTKSVKEENRGLVADAFAAMEDDHIDEAVKGMGPDNFAIILLKSENIIKPLLEKMSVDTFSALVNGLHRDAIKLLARHFSDLANESGFLFYNTKLSEQIAGAAGDDVARKTIIDALKDIRLFLAGFETSGGRGDDEFATVPTGEIVDNGVKKTLFMPRPYKAYLDEFVRYMSAHDYVIAPLGGRELAEREVSDETGDFVLKVDGVRLLTAISEFIQTKWPYEIDFCAHRAEDAFRARRKK